MRLPIAYSVVLTLLMATSEGVRSDDGLLCKKGKRGRTGGRTADTSNSSNPCCIDNMNKYSRLAKSDFYQIMRKTSFYLKNVLSGSSSKFEGHFLDMISVTENNTDTLLSTIYKMPQADHRNIIAKFFMKLKQYITNKMVDIRVTVDTFFDELFPLAFHYNVLNDKKGVGYKDTYIKCLKNIRHNLRPPPFSKVPQKLASHLQQAFSTAKLFLDTVKLATETINTTEYLNVESYCDRPLIKLLHCPPISSNARPCNLFCRNVLRGCLGHVQDLDSHWNTFLEKFIEFISHIKGHFNIDETLLALDSRISEAIMRAMELGPKYYPRVVQKCGLPEIQKPLKSIQSSKDDDASQRSLPVSTGVKLTKRLKSLVNSLQPSLGFYGSLADNMCRSDQLAGPSDLDQKCWTGSHIGRYSKMLVDVGFKAQDQNPEVKISTPHTTTIIMLKDKLLHVTNLLEKKVQENRMQADQLVIKVETNLKLKSDRVLAGSGAGATDDEDLIYAGSGSGGHDSPPNTGPNSDGGTRGADDGWDFAATSPTSAFPHKNKGNKHNLPKSSTENRGLVLKSGLATVLLAIIVSMMYLLVISDSCLRCVW